MRRCAVFRSGSMNVLYMGYTLRAQGSRLACCRGKADAPHPQPGACGLCRALLQSRHSRPDKTSQTTRDTGERARPPVRRLVRPQMLDRDGWRARPHVAEICSMISSGCCADLLTSRSTRFTCAKATPRLTSRTRGSRRRCLLRKQDAMRQGPGQQVPCQLLSLESAHQVEVHAALYRHPQVQMRPAAHPPPPCCHHRTSRHRLNAPHLPPPPPPSSLPPFSCSNQNDHSGRSLLASDCLECQMP